MRTALRAFALVALFGASALAQGEPPSVARYRVHLSETSLSVQLTSTPGAVRSLPVAPSAGIVIPLEPAAELLVVEISGEDGVAFVPSATLGLIKHVGYWRSPSIPEATATALAGTSNPREASTQRLVLRATEVGGGLAGHATTQDERTQPYALGATLVLVVALAAALLLRGRIARAAAGEAAERMLEREFEELESRARRSQKSQRSSG